MNVIVSQALALGLPVVATRHSGLPEQVVDGVNGFLVDEADFEALAERILRFSAEPELLAALGRAGRQYVSERYNATTLMDEQVAAYRELAARRG